MIKACVFLADGFEEVEALTVVDLLRRAQIYVDTISVTGEFFVTGSHGISVRTEELAEEVDYNEYEVVVLPGGMPGTLNLKAHPIVRKIVKGYAEEGRYVAAICAAPTILSDLGLIMGKKITCYPGMEPEIQGAALTHEKVTIDGNIITGQGVGAAIEFALQIIASLVGTETAVSIAESIVY